MSIAANIRGIQERIARAAARAGRSADEITLMAVSKTFPAGAIQEAHAAGLRVFGENRVQEFAGKFEAVRALEGAEFHLIGHLQSNKSSKAAEIFHAVDSVDSLKLAQRISDAAGKLGRTLGVLVEINVGNEAQKAGVLPSSAELEAMLAEAPKLPNLRLEGLMAIPPHTEDPEGARPYFRRMRELRDQIAARNLPGVSIKTLSIGMSHDFEIAVEEGSTCVRLGTAIFGARRK